MKILYHHRTASKDGQAVHIEEMVHALRELGHQVLVVGPSGSDDVHGGGMGPSPQHVVQYYIDIYFWY